MTKITAIAPANIALIKYWGMADDERTLPANPSISMTLSQCVSRTTVEMVSKDGPDEVLYRHDNGDLLPASIEFATQVRAQLERLRRMSGECCALRVATFNSFPTGAGIASSASGFAALTMAAAALLGLPGDAATLSGLARRSGSGSAARSMIGGFVQWPGDEADAGSPARQIVSPEHWPLHDLVAVVDAQPKAISSREGHRRALSSPYYSERLRQLPARTARIREALRSRDFPLLAETVEEEAIDLHLIAMSTRPPTFYWQPATLAVLAEVRRMRADGMDVCSTIDAGPNVHLLCTPDCVAPARAVLEALPGVQYVIADSVGRGPTLTSQHLL